MKHLNLYESYGVSSKEELYQKIKNKENEVRELSSFIEYLKKDREKEGITIREKKELIQYLESGSLPEENELKIIELDTSTTVLGEYSFSIPELSNMKNIFQEMYHPNMKSCMIAYYDFNPFPSMPRKLQQFENNLERVYAILSKV